MHASLRNINIGPFLSSFSLHIILFTRFACNNIIMKRTEVGKGVNNRIMLWPHSSFLSFVRHNVRPNKKHSLRAHKSTHTTLLIRELTSFACFVRA